MAHELDTSQDGRTAMMYTGQAPWHGLGTELDRPATAGEAIEAAGLGWTVKARPVFFLGRDAHHEIPNQYAIVRTDRRECLGIVAGKYQPIQNREAFAFLDPIIGKGEAVYHTAGSLRGGQRVWMLAKLPEPVEITRNDVVDQYLLLTNSHTGKEAMHIRFTPIRVVCMNTLSAAMRQDGVKARVWHSGNLREQYRRAADILGIARKVFKATAEMYQQMANAPMVRKMAADYYLALCPDNPESKHNTRTKNNRSRLLWLFENGTGQDRPGVRGTVWAAYNAVTEYSAHIRVPGTSRERRLWSNWFSSGEELRDRAMREAMKLV